MILDVPRFGQHFDPEQWCADGFDSPDDSRHWSERCCGVACVRMCLAFAGLPAPPLSTLLREGLALNGFNERGWIHARLAQLGQAHGLPGTAVAAGAEDLRRALGAGMPPILSVCAQLPQDGRRGGHLIVLCALDDDPGGQPQAVFRDPSRWGESHDRVPLARLLASYTGRAIVWHRPPHAGANGAC